jgi:probable HAF family extracellular repeat protein
MKRGLFCVFLLCLFSFVTLGVHGQLITSSGMTNTVPRYAVIDLGTLGGTFSETGGINEAGGVAGDSNTAGDAVRHAFLWENGVMTDLGTLGGPNSLANAVSERAAVVGIADTPNPGGNPLICFDANQCHAYIWQGGVMTDLGTLGGTNSGILGDGINDSGQAVGLAETTVPDPTNPPYSEYHAFLWQNETMIDLGTLGGPKSIAWAINNSGQVVGAADVTKSISPITHAFMWQQGVMTDLGTLGGSTSTALAINNRGQVVGVSNLPGDLSIHTFLWQNGGMVDLGVLDPNVNSVAGDINNRGQVVGYSFDMNANNFTALLWENGVIYNLNDLLVGDSGLQLLFAFQINDGGQIVGTAVQKSTGEIRAYLANPVNGSGVAARAAVGGSNVAVPQNAAKLLQQKLRLYKFPYRPISLQ